MVGYVKLEFPEGVNSQFAPAFENAAALWNRVIISGVPPVVLDSSFNANRQCGVNFQYNAGEALEGLTIFSTVEAIDGVGGILSMSGPCASSNSFSILGRMLVDSFDAKTRLADSSLEDTIAHEIGQVLGVGSLWNTFGLLNGNSYIGENGLEGLADLEFPNAVGIPVSNGNWEEEVFDNELMTLFMNVGVPNPLSIMTVKSLRDLNFVVDISAAQDYAVPNEFTRLITDEKLELGNVLEFPNRDINIEIARQRVTPVGIGETEVVIGDIRTTQEAQVLPIIGFMGAGFVAVLGAMKYFADKQRKEMSQSQSQRTVNPMKATL